MPHIDVAMLASRTRPLFSRASSISSDVSSVQHTFSSWDNCMAEDYCKWPVVAAIIVVGLILLSIVWCIVRCACCGLSCCCTCFSCFKCCGECCGMCDGRKDRSHKNIDDPFRPQPQPFQPQPTPYTGYQAPAPMGYEAPKYAQFETGKSGLAVEPPKPVVHEDALPPMPSWEGANSRRIPTEEKDEGMEMGNLTPDGQSAQPLMSGGVGGARTPGATSPMNEAGGNFFGGRGAPGQNGYIQGQPGGNMPYGPGGISRTGSPAMMNGRGGMGAPGTSGPGMNGPGGISRTGSPAMMNGRGGMGAPGMGGPGMNGPGMGYGGPNRGGMAMGGPPRGQFNRSPGAQGFNNLAPAPQSFNNQAPGPQGFNNQRPGFPPAAGYRGPPQRQYSNNSDSPHERNPPPQRQYSNDSGAPYPPNGPQRQFSGNVGFPQPQRQYSSDAYNRPSQDMYRPPASPSSPLNNSGGFDFNLGGNSPSRYELPSEHQFGQGTAQSNYAPSTTAPPSYATRGPQQERFSPPNALLHGERSYSPIEEIHEMPASEPAVSRPDGGPAYPGYKPYSPAPREGARNTPPPPSALMPGRPNY